MKLRAIKSASLEVFFIACPPAGRYNRVMIYLIFSLIVLACPFLLIFIFDDKKRGFVYVLFWWIVFQAVSSLLLQFFRIFYFWPVFFINIAVAVCALFFFIKRKKARPEAKNIDWIIIAVLLISTASLCQVHYNYTGKINFATDQVVSYHDVKNINYPYPYFSDEWDAVSFIKHSISSGFLPNKNPFNNSPITNFVAPFFSFLAGLMVFLKADPLLSFNFFSIAINVLIVVLCYVFLRINNLSKSVSGITALAVILIPSAANLPGIWNLLPIHMGITASLIGFCFMSLRNKNLAFFCSLLVLAFYPPLILFYGLALPVFLLSGLNFSRKKVFLAITAVFVLSILSPFFLKILPENVSGALTHRLFYQSLTGDFIAQYNFYDVVPFFCTVFFLLGIYPVFRNTKWLFSQFVLGAFFWILYSKITNRIIIDYERVVFFTSIIAVMISGFGLKVVLGFFQKKLLLGHPVSDFIKIGFAAFFILQIPFYTQQENWQKFVLVNPKTGKQVYSRAPANNYLVQDDIKLFNGIKNKNFLSVPWKGLVIAAATENYPAVVKEGIISAGSAQIIGQFLQADCNGKLELAKKEKLDYIYLYNFDCKSFEKVGQSREGFVLYKISK